MKIKLLVDLAGPHTVPPRLAGSIIDVTEDEAGRMIASRFALPAPAAREKAVKGAPKETRAKT